MQSIKQQTSLTTFSMDMHTWQLVWLAAWLGLAAGMAIGIVGDAGVR